MSEMSPAAGEKKGSCVIGPPSYYYVPETGIRTSENFYVNTISKHAAAATPPAGKNKCSGCVTKNSRKRKEVEERRARSGGYRRRRKCVREPLELVSVAAAVVFVTGAVLIGISYVYPATPSRGTKKEQLGSGGAKGFGDEDGEDGLSEDNLDVMMIVGLAIAGAEILAFAAILLILTCALSRSCADTCLSGRGEDRTAVLQRDAILGEVCLRDFRLYNISSVRLQTEPHALTQTAK